MGKGVTAIGRKQHVRVGKRKRPGFKMPLVEFDLKAIREIKKTKEEVLCNSTKTIPIERKVS